MGVTGPAWGSGVGGVLGPPRHQGKTGAVATQGTHVDVQESNGLHQDVTKYAQGVHTRQREPVAVVEKVLSVHTHLEGRTDRELSSTESARTCLASLGALT